MYGKDVCEEILRLSAELRDRSHQARAESARLVAKSKTLVTEMTSTQHATHDPGCQERSRPQDRAAGLPAIKPPDHDAIAVILRRAKTA